MSKSVPRKANLNMTSGMKTSHFGQGSGKMSGKHGTGPVGAGHTLRSSGGKRLGAECKGFKEGPTATAGFKRFSKKDAQ